MTTEKFSTIPIKPVTAEPSKNSKQPRALSILVFAEMWERFGFYIVQALLVLYLTQALGLSDSESYTITGAFTAFVYISPIIGGYIADQVFGFKTAIIVGAILFIIGYGLLAWAGQELLYVSLAIIIIGNGFFKPNISSLLGALYQKSDPRREAGFTFFYMGINLGSMAATLISGFVKDAFGWWAGFGLASIGLVLGLLNFVWGAKYLIGYGEAPIKNPNAPVLLKIFNHKITVACGVIIGIPIISILLHYKELTNILLFAAAVILLIGLVILAFRYPKEQRNRMLTLIWLTIISVLFWAVFFQIFFSVNLFVDRNIDRVIWGVQIPTVAFISFEAFFIVVLAPFLAKLWSYLNYKRKNPSTVMKFFLSFISMTIAFLLLYISTHFHIDGLISPWWIPIAYFFITIAEMLLSPIGLSAVTVLSPQRLVGMMMGVWLIAIGYGGKLAGVLAKISSIPEGIKNPLIASHYYGNAFFTYAVIAFILAIVTLIFVPWLRRITRNE